MTAKLPRPRGQPKNNGAKGNEKLSSVTVIEGEITEMGKEVMVLSKEMSNLYGIMTRARSAILLGMRLGLTYYYPDVIAEGHIASHPSWVFCGL